MGETHQPVETQFLVLLGWDNGKSSWIMGKAAALDGRGCGVGWELQELWGCCPGGCSRSISSDDPSGFPMEVLPPNPWTQLPSWLEPRSHHFVSHLCPWVGSKRPSGDDRHLRSSRNPLGQVYPRTFPFPAPPALGCAPQVSLSVPFPPGQGQRLPVCLRLPPLHQAAR